MTLRGVALTELGRDSEGIELLRRARAAGNESQRSEASYELAKVHFRAGEYDRAEGLLSPLVDDGASEGGEPVVAKALELYGRIELIRRRRPMAARHFIDALETLRQAARSDNSLRVSLVESISKIAVDAFDLRLHARVRRELRTMDLVPGSTIIGELLVGDESNAWTLAFDALRRAPMGSRHVAALLELANVSRAVGDLITPTFFIRTAVDVASSIDWNTADAQTMLTLIREAASVDVAAAGDMLRLYEAIERSRDDRAAEELSALEACARAAICVARDEPSVTVSNALLAAIDVSRASGNHYVEATAILTLLSVVPDDELLRRADELTRLVPVSWLRRKYETLAEQACGPLQLSAAERRVMLAICEGLSTAEIAQRFGKSKNTIRNQTRRIFEVLKVHTRANLIVKFAAMGMLPGINASVGDGSGRRMVASEL